MVYREAPWIFKGRVLYQLQLVKTEEARKYVPPEFKIVDFFGYTLGGIYLARYDDSPVGAFDELVALAGIVWNPPTSCAWAARVFVNNREARDHGVNHIGLPSRVGTFNEVAPAGISSHAQQGKKRDWWRLAAPSRKPSTVPGATLPEGQPLVLEVHNRDPVRSRGLRTPVCQIVLPATDAASGPRMHLDLPSFSGATPEVPGLLQYTCALQTNVRLLPPARVIVPPPADASDAESGEHLGAILTGKPLLCIEFSDAVMHVDEPVPLRAAAAAADAERELAPQWAAAKLASMTASAPHGRARLWGCVA